MRRITKQRGVIAAGHLLTAKAGSAMFRQGGNAIDAAVAASFATFACEPSLTLIGGGGFALTYIGETGKSFLYDFFADMPGLGKKWNKNDLDFHSVYLNFVGALQEFHIGKGSVAVPGTVQGLFLLHKHHGRLPFKEILAPAIRYARYGVKITKNQSFVMRVVGDCITDTPDVRKIYAPGGKILSEGETLFNPELADTLEALIKEGPSLFYQGEIGQKMVAHLQDGGLLTQKDLDHYRVIIRKPLSLQYRGEEILTNPPPSLGGSLIQYSLKLLQTHSFNRLSFSDPDFLKLLVTIMKKTNESRNEKINRQKTPRNQTTHLSTMDSEGNAVSLTTSHGEGSGVVVPGTGVVLNNLLGEEDIHPHGFHTLPPGVRLTSMMAPTIALNGGKPYIVLGSGGSNRLRTAILQTLIKIIDFKMPIRSAVNGPRIHWENGKLDVEPGFSKKTIRELQELGNPFKEWEEKNLFFGGVHAVMPRDGAGDLRRGGAVCK